MKTSVILLLFFTLQVNFCVSQNTWTQKTDFGGHEREAAVGFSIGSKGYAGLGVYSVSGSSDFYYCKDFWEYDPATDTWTKKADFPGTERDFAVGFSIGNKGYVGLGYSYSNSQHSETYFKDFWEYDPATDTWTQKTDFPGHERRDAVGFSIGIKGYAGFGYYHIINNYYCKDFWEYDSETDTWTQKADLPGMERCSAIGFSIGANGYIGTGYTDDSVQFNGLLKDFWEYNPITDIWVQKADFGGMGRCHAIGFSIGAKGYIGTGCGENNFKKDLWEYDTLTDTWTQKANLPDTERVDAIGFSIGAKGYMGTGCFSEMDSLGYYFKEYHFKDFFEYSPLLKVNETGLNEDGIKVYSGIAGMLTIISPVSLIEVNIYNVLGKNLILYRPDVLQNSVEINVSDIGTGIYFAKIQTANGETISKKLIITN